MWDIQGCTEASKFTKRIQTELKKYNLPENWFNVSDRYTLRKNHSRDELSERLVIEWGPATVSRVQSRDKEIVEIKGKKTIGDFNSFNQVDLDFYELQMMTQFPDTNLTWFKALSSVNGVYLIKDKKTGKLYAGSTYGEQGIFGRWAV